MAGEAKRVLYNAFEQALTGDLNRQQILGSTALQEVLAAISGRVGVETGNALVNQWLSIPALPTAGAPATTEMSVPAGKALYQGVALNSDESDYRFIEWALTVVTHAAADPANPRIDLIVVDPTALVDPNNLPFTDSDPLLRNVLVNPTTRAIQGITVDKTRAPEVPVRVVTGAAAASPTPPAVPAGMLALYEIWVPATAPDSSTFKRAHRLFRSSLGQGNGVVQGFNVVCDEATNETYLQFTPGTTNRISFRGVLMDLLVSAKYVAIPDTTNNPFAAPAPATADSPYYIYFVGGLSPQLTNDAAGGITSAPFCLIESTRVPNPRTGAPTGTIMTPRGATTAALYVGLGFVRRGSILRKAITRTGCWVQARDSADQNFESQSMTFAAGLPVTTAVTLASAPAICREVRMTVAGDAAAGPGNTGLVINGTTGTPPDGEVILRMDNTSLLANVAIPVHLEIPAGGPHFTAGRQGGNVAGPIAYYLPRAYKDYVLRLDGGNAESS